MIEVVDHGRVDFALPYLPDYLRERESTYPMRAFSNDSDPLSTND